MERDALEKYHQAALETGADVLIGDITRVEGANSTRYHLFSHRFVLEEKKDIDKLVHTIICNWLNPWPPIDFFASGYGSPVNRAIRRDVIEKHTIRFDVRLYNAEDLLFNVLVCLNSNRIAYIMENTYFYRFNKMSITNKRCGKEFIYQNETVIKVFWDLSKNLNKTQEWSAALSTMALGRLISLYRQYVFHPKSEIPWFQRRKMVRELALRDEYRNALPNAILSALPRFRRIVGCFVKKEKYSLIVLMYIMRTIVKHTGLRFQPLKLD